MIYSIQVLRFFAAFFVVLTHSMEALDLPISIGGFGVDLFFVVSGFIISYVTEFSQSGFARKRIIRIVPLYWLFTAFVAAIAFFAPSLLKSAEFDIAHIVASLFFVPLWTEQTEFHPILKLGWTLNCEVFFYVLFFVAMQISHRYRELLAAVLIAAAVIGLTLAPLDPHNPLKFYANTILFEFIFGMVLSKFYRRLDFARFRAPPAVAVACILVGVTVLVATSTFSTGIDKFLRWGLAASLTVYGALSLEELFQGLSARSKALVALSGDLSYPMYLVHIYAIAVLVRLLDHTFTIYQLFPIALVSTLLAAWAADAWYDKPVRHSLRRKAV